MRFGWIYCLWLTGALWFIRRRICRRGGVVVLTLHRVVGDREFLSSSSLPGMLMRERTFDDFLAWASRACEIHDVNRGPECKPLPSRPRIALTFDDGWLDNYRLAQPIAERYAVPMTIFLCPDLMGRRFPFWPERFVRLIREPKNRPIADDLCGPSASELTSGDIVCLVDRLKRMDPADRDALIRRLEDNSNGLDESPNEPTNETMTWVQALELRRRSVNFGAHTMTHAILTQVPPAGEMREIRQSRAEMINRLEKCDCFAYPNGDHDREAVAAVAECGFRFAFTVLPGIWTASSDPLRIPRVNVSEKHVTGPTGRFSPVVFQYSVFWRCRKG